MTLFISAAQKRRVKLRHEQTCFLAFEIAKQLSCILLKNADFFVCASCYLLAGISESELVGLALDSHRELLYFTDRVKGIIAEITTDGLRRRDIFNDQKRVPRAIVVDSYSR